MDREAELLKLNQIRDIVSTPTHFMTLCPLTPHLQPETFNWVFEETLNMFYYDVFGHHWKENLKSKPVFVLYPEKKSSKTIKNRTELLHYHGIAFIEKPWIAEEFENRYPRLFKRKIKSIRKKKAPNYRLQTPAVDFKTFNHALTDECFAYCTKHYGYPKGFSHKDVLVTGLSKNINRINGT
jgi:hypothetical protein